MHKQKPKKFGYDPMVVGPRARALGPEAGTSRYLKNRNESDMEAEKRKRPGTDILIGRNPVTEALRAGRPIEKILVQEGAGGAAGKLIALAKENGVRIERVRKSDLEKLVGKEPHQGILAIASAHAYASMDDIFRRAEEAGEPPLIVVLDGIEDPHNLGAILRTAECAGFHGVIIPKRNACGLTEIVAKSSAGAIEYVPCVRTVNIARTLEELKERGVWIYACDMDGENYTDCAMTGAAAVVIGAEGKGISRLVKEKCDFTVSIPLRGRIQSLNASNAAAVLMYEVVRQRSSEEK